MTQPYKKKLIEVAIPLEAINKASIKEKSSPFLRGHSRSLHQWWARRPLAACRAVLFAQLVDDPSSNPDEFPTVEQQDAERERLFGIIEELVIWENSTNEAVLNKARAEIIKSCGEPLPPVYDPFSGGCSIPLEAQRLGLPAYGSDLNPVAVMIGKAMIEIPPRFKDKLPVHPGGPERNTYRNVEGLAEDVKYYGEWMRERAFERIGHLYPKVNLPEEYGGGQATVIAWIWSRTVPSPDPVFADVQVPIASSFALSTKKGKEAWIEPIVDKAARTITYRIHKGGTKEQLAEAKKGTKAGRGAHFRCLMSDTAITPDYVKEKGKAGEMGQSLIAIVAEGQRGRIYIEPLPAQERIAFSAQPDWRPAQRQPKNPRWFSPPDYGMETFGDLFTDRQLVALNTFSDLVGEARGEIERDALTAGMRDDSTPLRGGGKNAKAYAEAVSVYLAFAVDKVADYGNCICGWNSTNQNVRQLFARQAIPMSWDFVESNPFGRFGNIEKLAGGISSGLSNVIPRDNAGIDQVDAATLEIGHTASVISTDPPYYDNIGYADLSDFFYIWLRKALQVVYPGIMGTLAVPKAEELVATPYRHGGRILAESFFLDGMTEAITRLVDQTLGSYPATIYYAFKQSEIEQEGLSSTGWVTFLQAVIASGYSIVGTWPVRTERAARTIATGTNALSNSVVLVCRKKEDTSETITRAEFIRALKRELPGALEKLLAANIAPADMPQSAIGPGIGIFSRYQSVLESDDSEMSVKTALQIINRELDEYFSGIEGEFDAETRFAVTWFEQNGEEAGDYGTANNIATARGISVESVAHAGIVKSSAGKVRILKRSELERDWDPQTDDHLTHWECCQYLIRALDNGEYEAALLMKKMGAEKADTAKDLAYRLYDICDKKGWSKQATAYNGLIAVWSDLTAEAATISDDVLGGDQMSFL